MDSIPQREERLHDWMLKAQAGDKLAYGLLLNELYGFLAGYLGKMGLAGQERGDCIQETMFALHRARHTFSPLQRFLPWFITIARHKLVDHFRRSADKHLKADITPDELAWISSGLDSWLDLKTAFASLPEVDRSILSMARLSGYSISSIAEKIGISEQNVRVRTHRALRRLRGAVLADMGFLGEP